MCGIAGFERRAEDVEARADALTRRLARRGPDGSGFEQVGSWALVQTRLAVVDLSPAVRYPMPNEDGRLRLQFNGEIYNHTELRRELLARGHTFRTACDAEVVVHGYEEWGDAVFERMNGMWAIALVDTHSDELVLCRDARGIKPLVRTLGSGPFAFASDSFALVAAGLSKGVPDRDAIAEFAAFQYVPPPRTGIADLSQVEPGTILRRRPGGEESVERWAERLFSPEPKSKPSVSLDEARDALRSSVSRQVKADVPVGVFLSGGIDSALVLKYALEAGARPVAFTLGFEGVGGYDETPAAARVASELGVEHRVDVLPTDFEATVEVIGSAFDSPLADPSAIAALPLAQFARREVKVALTGTGGDDLFAGYYRHRAWKFRRLLDALPDSVRNAVEHAGPRRGDERRNLLTQMRSYLVRMSDADSGDDRSLYLSLVANSTSPAMSSLLCDGVDPPAARALVADKHGFPSGRFTLGELQDFELATYLPGDLLAKEDRATMAWGLEGRVPLLDDDVARLAARTRPGQRATLRTGKILLRQLARRDLGPRLAATRKRGFAVPLGHLFRSGWREDAVDWLGSSQSELFSAHSAVEVVDSEESNALDVWTLVVLAAWERELGRSRRLAGGSVAAVRTQQGAVRGEMNSTASTGDP